MIQKDSPIENDAFEILNFLSGVGFWLVLAVLLIAVVVYKKFRK